MGHSYVVYIAVAHMAMAHMAVAQIFMIHEVMACTDMAHTVIAHLGMAHLVMAYIVLATLDPEPNVHSEHTVKFIITHQEDPEDGSVPPLPHVYSYGPT